MNGLPPARLRRALWLVCRLALMALLTACRGSTDALDRVLATGVLRVGMDASFPPFEYVDDAGNLIGFDVDLAREVAARLGVRAEFVANLPYDGLYDALTAGRVDAVISALYVDPARMGSFSYSAPYFDAGQVLVARDETLAEDLAGRTLAVEFGSEGDVVARGWQRRLSGLRVLPCQTAAEALERLVAGEADAALVDHLSALAAMGAGYDLAVVASVTAEPYAVAVRRQDRGLLRAVDAALAEMRADGTMTTLQRRWFGAAAGGAGRRLRSAGEGRQLPRTVPNRQCSCALQRPEQLLEIVAPE